MFDLESLGAWVNCAPEGGNCKVPSSSRVKYGSGDKWSYNNNVTDSINCDNTTFGGDPAFGVAKSCWYSPL
jgi:hypothetical protein